MADRAAHNREVAQDSGLPLFVSTPDLLHDLPTAQWLPICVDPSEFANDEPLMERAVPRVLHMPSKRNPPIKGSQYVDPLMRKLHDEGLIEYVTPGHMKHSEVPAVMASADIVIVQDTYQEPADFDHFINETWWDRTNHWPMLGPKSAQECNAVIINPWLARQLFALCKNIPAAFRL